jgi:hypothetical protein
LTGDHGASWDEYVATVLKPGGMADSLYDIYGTSYEDCCCSTHPGQFVAWLISTIVPEQSVVVQQNQAMLGVCEDKRIKGNSTGIEAYFYVTILKYEWLRLYVIGADGDAVQPGAGWGAGGAMDGFEWRRRRRNEIERITIDDDISTLSYTDISRSSTSASSDSVHQHHLRRRNLFDKSKDIIKDPKTLWSDWKDLIDLELPCVGSGGPVPI